MKKIIITLAFAALLAGCDRNTATDNNTTTTPSTGASTNSMTTNAPATP